MNEAQTKHDLIEPALHMASCALSCRQIADIDTLHASNDLRQMRDMGILEPKGKGRATYYIWKEDANTEASILNTEAQTLNTDAAILNTDAAILNTEAQAPNTDGSLLNTDGLASEDQSNTANTYADAQNTEAHALGAIRESLPAETREAIDKLANRENNKGKVEKLILKICSHRPYRLSELSMLLDRQENYLSRMYIKPLLDTGKLNYLYPDMVKHPDQAYETIAS